MTKWKRVFGDRKPLIGMVHLGGLPGSPGARDFGDVMRRATREAEILDNLGFDGLLIENYGDLPFRPGRAEEQTIVAMTLIAREIADRVSVPVGVNVLRNDPISALAIAALVGGLFIRVNVHTGVRATDQGMIEGRAHETLRYRDLLKTEVLILADEFVKHSRAMDGMSLEESARETAYRGLADALIVSGPSTGEEIAPDDLSAIRRAVPDRPVVVGSGARSGNIRILLEAADGIIVGSDLKDRGEAHRAVDPARAERFLRAAGR
jgi:membrane complex biogenesis BtpA family protein